MSDIKLPPLPEKRDLTPFSDSRIYGYAEADMRNYARAAVEANRVPDGADATAYRYCHRCGYKSETVVITKAAVPPVAQPASGYVQTVPDHCDRIVWRNAYYHLPIAKAQPAERKSLTNKSYGRDRSAFDTLPDDFELGDY